jgi:hypothetical protein
VKNLVEFFVAAAISLSAMAAPVDVPRGIDHEPFEQLLKKFVDERGRVNYAAWKKSAADLKILRDYLAQFEKDGPFAEGNEKTASLINAYNALTISWILENYPTPSIQSLKNSFNGARHNVGGRLVSLDEIEHDTLRPLAGFRAHAALVCAARSCPPLAREAFRADKLDAQLDERMRVWLAREDLNRFVPRENRAEISPIFRWFSDDFEKAGGVRNVLVQYGPEKFSEFLQSDYKISHLSYHWGLNDQSKLGEDYGTGRRARDMIRNIFR